MSSAKPELLIFPRGVRFPRRNEIPKRNDDALERVSKANITTGYVREDPQGENFKAYFEANVHAPKIFEVFCALALSLMPDVAAPIIGLKDEEPTFGSYTDRDSALGVFRPHADLLQNDGFIEFGITFQYRGRIEEIFVKSPKYFQIWTNDPAAVVSVFEKNGIPNVPRLEFIDQYPMVSESINVKGNAAWPGLFEAMKESLKELPLAVPDQ